MEKYDVFLSYSSKNEKAALKIKQKFIESGLSVWISKDSIHTGEDFAEAIPNAIYQSKTFVVVLSKDSQSSLHVGKEITIAENFGKTVFPLKIEQFELDTNFMYHFSNIQFVDIDPNNLDTESMERVIAQIKDVEYVEKEVSFPGSEITFTNFLSYPPDEIAEAIKNRLIILAKNVMKNPGPTVKALIATVAVLLVATNVYNYFESHVTVDVGECLTLNVSGINKYGIITGSIDYSKLPEKTRDKLINKNIYNYDFTIEFSQSDYLSNGDVVQIDVSSDKALSTKGVKIKNASLKQKIEDLPEGIIIDPFEYVNLRYEGLNGEGVAELVCDKNDFNFEYVLSKSDNLTVGDSILVTVNYDDKQLANQGYGLSTNKKTFIVNALDELVYSEEQVSQALLDKLSSELSDLIVAQAKSEFPSYGENQYRGASVNNDLVYLIKVKEDRYDPKFNGIVFLQPVKLKVATFFGMGGITEKDIYARSIVFNISVNSDGKNKYDIENREISYFEDYDLLLESIEGKFAEKYDIIPLFETEE